MYKNISEIIIVYKYLKYDNISNFNYIVNYKEKYEMIKKQNNEYL